MSETETLEETAEEGQRLAEAAKGAGLPLLLIGGVAVWVRLPDRPQRRARPELRRCGLRRARYRTARRSLRS